MGTTAKPTLTRSKNPETGLSPGPRGAGGRGAWGGARGEEGVRPGSGSKAVMIVLACVVSRPNSTPEHEG